MTRIQLPMMLIMKKVEPRITAIQPRVIAAFFDVGLRNAGMPLEIASTPDSATAPDANARAKMNIEMPPM